MYRKKLALKETVKFWILLNYLLLQNFSLLTTFDVFILSCDVNLALARQIASKSKQLCFLFLMWLPIILIKIYWKYQQFFGNLYVELTLNSRILNYSRFSSYNLIFLFLSGALVHKSMPLAKCA